MERLVKLSVKNLIEFVLRSGDIDDAYMSAKRAVEGIRIHQKIQRAREKQARLSGDSYEKEVSLALAFKYEDFDFQISGRADGILKTKDKTIVEEIKSTTRELETIVFDQKHLAQAKCYGYIYCLQQGLGDVSFMLTYSHVDTGCERVFTWDMGFAQLEEFFYDVIKEYYVFAQLDIVRIEERNGTAKDLEFPYEAYREGQRDMAVAVYKTIASGKKLFAQAPTGTGKTISALYPSIKALSTGLCSKIFCLTAKTISRKVVNDTLAIMSQRGLKIRSLTLTAKDKICFTKGAACNPRECKYAKGHFDRVNKAVFDIITNEYGITGEVVTAYALAHDICPFEFSLDLISFVDCIVCDYNYVYDPKVHLKRLFDDNEKKELVVLNDEAHNLVDRSREMFSTQIKTSDLDIRREYRKKDKALYNAIIKIKNIIDDFGEFDGVIVEKDPDDQLYYQIMNFAQKADKWLGEHKDEDNKQLLDLYFIARDFIRIWELFDDSYVLYVDNTHKNTVVKLLCLDPSGLLAQTHNKVVATVFYSATLTPMEYFRDVLGGDSKDYALRLGSPFKEENLGVLINSGISTYYKGRENSYVPIVHSIFQMFNAKKGNYLAFFPSYEYLNKVYEIFVDMYPEVKTRVQVQNMTEEEKSDFLKEFDDNNEEDGLLAFTVLGGVFSESIDLTGDRLIGVCIIGVGLPMITTERNIIKDYYHQKGIDGFDYAYVYPGVNKVMQAAGRVIRTEKDVGCILLIDSRFSTVEYQKLFPREWSQRVDVSGGDKISAALASFWAKAETRRQKGD